MLLGELIQLPVAVKESKGIQWDGFNVIVLTILENEIL